MNCLQKELIYSTPAHYFTIGKFVEFEDDDFYHDGKITGIVESFASIEFLDNGQKKHVIRALDEIRLADQVAAEWWTTALDPFPESITVSKNRKTDSLGRGLKGYGHGSIDMKPVRRKRKNGRIWEKYQAWYQWEDETGKHCRYLRKGVDLTVQRLIDEGATVEMILESIGKSKDSSKGKTR